MKEKIIIFFLMGNLSNMNPPQIQISTSKTNLLLPTKKKKTFWQGLTKNSTSKIVSLIIAILLYYHAHYGSNVSRNVQIPIIQPKLMEN